MLAVVQPLAWCTWSMDSTILVHGKLASLKSPAFGLVTASYLLWFPGAADRYQMARGLRLFWVKTTDVGGIQGSHREGLCIDLKGSVSLSRTLLRLKILLNSRMKTWGTPEPNEYVPLRKRRVCRLKGGRSRSTAGDTETIKKLLHGRARHQL